MAENKTRNETIYGLVMKYERMDASIYDPKDMIYDELMINPDRSDEEIAHTIAMRVVFA